MSELTYVVTIQNTLKNRLEVLRLKTEFLGLDIDDKDVVDNGTLSEE